MKIAILYIGIGEYVKLWEGFFCSMERNFLPEQEKQYFVFTDAKTVYGKENECVHMIYQEDLGWPNNTMLRFKFFLSIERELKNFDYIYFMNANICCIRKVSEEDILPRRGELVVVQHPAFYDKSIEQYTYDRNPKSQAYVPQGEGKYYVVGGVNGGGSKAYLEMVRCLSERTEEDLRRGVIALWHDESQLNRYIIDFPEYRLLSPSFCFQEGANVPFERVLVARNKRNYFEVNKIKQDTVFVDEMIEKAMSADRLEQKSNLLEQWMQCKQNGYNLQEYFEKRKIKRIAVYGYAKLGQLFLNEIRNTEVQVAYVIDKNAKMIEDKNYIICTQYCNEMIEVDAVVVAAVYSYYHIFDDLIKKTKKPIISLENIIYDCALDVM